MSLPDRFKFHVKGFNTLYIATKVDDICLYSISDEEDNSSISTYAKTNIEDLIANGIWIVQESSDNMLQLRMHYFETALQNLQQNFQELKADVAER